MFYILPFLIGGMFEQTNDRIEGSSSGTINGIEREPKKVDVTFYQYFYKNKQLT